MQIAISGYETIKLYDARFTISERIGGRLIESSERWQKEQGMKGGGGGGVRIKIEQVQTRTEWVSKFWSICDNVMIECPQCWKYCFQV